MNTGGMVVIGGGAGAVQSGFDPQRPSSLAPGGPIGAGGEVPGGANTTPVVPFMAPRRPNHGVEGRPIVLRANHFAVRIPGGTIQHYQVDVQPDKCPRRVNR